MVIPTRRRAPSLERVLEALTRQVSGSPPFEVIVVCDGEGDPGADLVRSRAWPVELRLLEQPPSGPAAARNTGIAAAQGGFVIFLDDDVIPAPDFVLQHAAAHDGHVDRVVIGPLLPTAEPRPPWITWEFKTLHRLYEGIEAGRWQPSWRQFHTGNASVRAEHLRKVGGFDPSFTRAEDIELGWRFFRAGLQFVFWPAAGGVHIASRSFRSWVSIGYRYGKADVSIARSQSSTVLLDLQASEFRSRHPYTRRLVRWGLRNRATVKPITWVGWFAIVTTSAGGFLEVAHSVCSAVFNLAHWCGVNDAGIPVDEILDAFDGRGWRTAVPQSQIPVG